MELELRLREVLAEIGMEQQELAEKTGLSVRTVSDLCNNKTKRYPKEALEKIAEALNIDDISKLIRFKK